MINGIAVNQRIRAYQPALVPTFTGHTCVCGTAALNGSGMATGDFVPAAKVEGSPPRGTGLT